MNEKIRVGNGLEGYGRKRIRIQRIQLGENVFDS